MKKATLGIFIAVALVVSFCGCGSTFNPSTTLKAGLDIICTGDSDIADELSDEEIEQCKEAYNESIDDMVKEAIDTYSDSDIDLSIVEDKMEQFAKYVYSNAKYEVSEEYEETEDGVYAVDVKIYPETYQEEVMGYLNGDFVTEWQEKRSSYSSQEEFMKDMLNDWADNLVNAAKNTGYGDPVNVTIHITDTGDDYEFDEDDMQKFWNNLWITAE